MFSLNPNADKLAAQCTQDRIRDTQQRQLVRDIQRQNSISPRWRYVVGLIGNLFVLLGKALQTQSMTVEPINTISRLIS